MEVVVPVQEFHFDGATPFLSAPSSPKRIEFYYHYTTAPASPTAASVRSSPPSKGKEHASAFADDEDDDFAFDFSGHLDKGVLPPEPTTADELFEKGKIRPLKFPLPLISPSFSRQIVGKHSDPFSNSMAEAAREGRGRNRGPSISSSRSRKGSRSLSPLRDAGEIDGLQAPFTGSTSFSCKGSGGDVGGSRKWCFKDLLLFRSASEGRATGDRRKDPLRKYTAACSSPIVKTVGGGDDSRGSSFRMVDGGSSARRESGRGLSSPHALHYEASRAAAEEMRKRTALPYKEGFFSFLRFAPGLSNSFKKKNQF